MTTRSKSAKKDLGRLLLERGWATEEQLRLALERQRRSGGALSTALLELEVVSEGQLLNALADLHGLPPAGAAELASIPSTVVALLSPREASRYRAVPFAVAAGRADVATDRPDSLDELDELSFLLGKRLAVYVTTEVRLADALERCYGIARPARLGELAGRLSGAPRPAESRSLQPKPPAGADAVPGAPVWQEEPERASVVTSRFRPLSPSVAPDPRRVIALTPDERRALRAEARAQAQPLEDALLRLELADSARQVGDTILEALAPHFEVLVLLRPRGDRWVGWLGIGPALDVDRLREADFGDAEASFLLELEPGVDAWSGSLAPLPAHRRLSAAWGGDLGGTFTAAGVRLGDRLICVLLGRPRLEEQPALADRDLRRLCDAAARSFQALLAGEHDRDH